MEAKLVDLERTKKEMKATAPDAVAYEGEKYPYGTCLRFEKAEMEKLGLDAAKLEVGQKVEIRAVGEVTNISSYDSTNGKDESCAIQITSMSLAYDLGSKGNKAYRDARKSGAGKPE
jgi:hypothetical protein